MHVRCVCGKRIVSFQSIFVKSIKLHLPNFIFIDWSEYQAFLLCQLPVGFVISNTLVFELSEVKKNGVQRMFFRRSSSCPLMKAEPPCRRRHPLRTKGAENRVLNFAYFNHFGRNCPNTVTLSGWMPLGSVSYHFRGVCENSLLVFLQWFT